MKKPHSIALALAAGLACTGAGVHAQPVELEGVKLEATSPAGSTTLALNGAGLRTRAFFKVYVAGLYLPQKAPMPRPCWPRKAPGAWSSPCCAMWMPRPLPMP